MPHVKPMTPRPVGARHRHASWHSPGWERRVDLRGFKRQLNLQAFAEGSAPSGQASETPVERATESGKPEDAASTSTSTTTGNVKPARPVWLPGLTPPAHLDGSMPGDYGFDPLRLGTRPKTLTWFRQAELQHARWAMLGAAGVLLTSALKGSGFPPWYEAGEVALHNLSIPFSTLVGTQIILMGFVEVKRWMDIVNPGSQAKQGSFGGLEELFTGGTDVGYPGGVFNPLKLDKNEFKMKQRELANGRLAMVACLGFAAQYSVSGTGPLENLRDHVDAPLAVNFATNGISLPVYAGW